MGRGPMISIAILVNNNLIMGRGGERLSLNLVV